MFQWCFKSELKVFQQSFKSVLSVFHKCFQGVSKDFNDVSRILQEYFRDVSRGLSHRVNWNFDLLNKYSKVRRQASHWLSTSYHQL